MRYIETFSNVSTNIDWGDIITKYEICYNGIFLFLYRFTYTRRKLSRCLISTKRFRSEIVASFSFCIVLHLPNARLIGVWFQRKDFVQKAHNINTIPPLPEKSAYCKKRKFVVFVCQQYWNSVYNLPNPCWLLNGKRLFYRSAGLSIVCIVKATWHKIYCLSSTINANLSKNGSNRN